MNLIIQGFTNLIKSKLGFLDENTKRIAEKRMDTCLNCPLRTDNKCDSNKQGEVVKNFNYDGEFRAAGQLVNGCSCNLAAKVLSMDSLCPLGKW